MPRAIDLESVEIFKDGRVTLRVRKNVVEGADTLMSEPHIIQLNAGENTAQAVARMNASLPEWPALPTAARTRIAAILAAEGR